MLRTCFVWIAICTSTLLISACGTLIKVTGSPTPNVIFTSAAKTVAVQLTNQANEDIAGQQTQSVMTMNAPTDTLQPIANTVVPSDTPVPPAPTDTPVPATATQPPIPCDQATFIKDVDTKDGATVISDSGFTKTWRIKNTGTCKWTREYAWVYVDGEQMGGPDVQWLEGTVATGEMVDISIELVAPTDPGKYTGYWELRNSSGVLFGAGDNADQPFSVTINVTAEPQVVYDFIENYCDATWESDTGSLPCPASEPDNLNGFVDISTSPRVETGITESEPALIMHPNTVVNRMPMPPDPSGAENSNQENSRYISGRFPSFKVKARDHFKAILGCLYDNTMCNVTFEVDYSINDGPVQNLGRWTQVYDGITTDVDISLKSLAGKNVEILLKVVSNGQGKEDIVYWLTPAIYR